MTLPLFNLFDMPTRTALHDEFRTLGPATSWRLMELLHDADLPRYEADSPEHERGAALAALARRHAEMAPTLTASEVDRIAERFATYGPRLQLESTYVTMWLRSPDALFCDVVAVQGRSHLENALAAGDGVLAAPLHLGPAYVIPALLAHWAPTRLVFNRMNFADIRAAAFPHLDIEAVSIDDDSTFATGLRTLKAGNVFAMFPELDPRGQTRHHRPVPFLGTTVLAPEGPALLARAARAPIVPVVLDHLGRGEFVLRFMPAIDSRDVDSSIAALWATIESAVRARPGDWEMWVEFDRMLAAGHR